MIKAIIIEDEQRAASMLELMLQDLTSDIKVIDKCYDLPSGVISVKKNHPQLIFLDIEMPGYSGLQLFDFFDEDEINFDIIFTTAFNDYAIKAFEMSAVDYLLKPIQVEKLNKAVQKFLKKNNSSFNNLSLLQKNLEINKTQKIIIQVGNSLEVLKVEEIKYFQAEGSYTKVFLKNEKHLMVSKNLRFFEDVLKSYPVFFRSHRSYIVNIYYVKKILKSDGGKIILEDGMDLPVSNEKIDQLIKVISS
jgi:two-component system LytT family response regulator